MEIRPFKSIRPMIYCYTTPGVTYHDGWCKIGYTEKQSVRERIAQQTHTAGVVTKLNWQDLAQYKDDIGGWFTDHDFHRYLAMSQEIEREPGTEWFHVDPESAQNYFNKFANRDYSVDEAEKCEYTLRREQDEAVTKTKDYFDNGGPEFLWNAKPRFGKTLAAYDLIRRCGYKRVLVVTNRPSIANSWAEDFNKFIGWRGGLCFVSELDSIQGKKGVLNRKQYLIDLRLYTDDLPGFVEFESLQNLKGSIYFGGQYDKLEWLRGEHEDRYGQKVKGLNFDLLIVDEAHEGVDTIRTDRAFKYIDREHTLYLSGTPFKALTDGQFNDDQIFNWTYTDEQAAKDNWDQDEYNPYEKLPRLAMFTYQLSNMIYDEVKAKADLSEDFDEFAFDLNEFFATNEAGNFVHGKEVGNFLKALTTQEKYPFSTPELRSELAHTLWLLDRVASAKALAKLLKSDPAFADYEIVLAAGDGRLDDETVVASSFDRVKKAIAENSKTITLSVGQLTVGVTIPEWSGVLMLCNMKSPSAYMQAAFRAQNPCVMERVGLDGKPEMVRKETAYVFDFDPARTLIIFDEFANNLSSDTVGGKGDKNLRMQKIRTLLNFFPVLGEDDEGRMVELDAKQVLSIPGKIKSVEVVRHGFMSNLLFDNIGNVFGASPELIEIIRKIEPSQDDMRTKRNQPNAGDLNNLGEIYLDENGDVEVPSEVVIGKTQDLFGDKIYQVLEQQLTPPDITRTDDVDKDVRDYLGKIKDVVTTQVVAPAVGSYKVSKSAQKRVERQVQRDIDRKFTELQDDFLQKKRIADSELSKNREAAAGFEQEIMAAEANYQQVINDAQAEFQKALNNAVQETIQKKPQEVVAQMEKQKRNEEKREAEDDVRKRLRSFSRTIPSFIMAYGSDDLELKNFGDKMDPAVFKEVAAITLDEFRRLRDEGHFFNESVFNLSIKEFLRKKAELADYFDDSHDEDIFDYIPPQKNNQIYTPRWVVNKMLDLLEGENPGCFDDPNATFADLYMKSGLYITEVVKRLYRSEAVKAVYPDDKERIRHIMKCQVYGMAPTTIIYLIAMNYILGFDEDLKSEILGENTAHFVEADTAEAAKNGTLEQLVMDKFGQ